MSQEPHSPLSRLARELLIAERSAGEPEALERRVLARARGVFEAGRPWPTEVASVPQARRSQRHRRLGVFMAAAAALAIGGIAAAQGGWWASTPALTPAARIMRPPARVVPPHPPTTQRPLAPIVEPISPVPPAASPVTGTRLPPPPSSATAEQPRSAVARQYAAELALLEPARSAIARGDNSGALSAIARHEREFRAGLLTEERSALRVRALWGMGRVAEAEAAAKVFRERYPRSALLGWMRTKHEP